MRRALLMSLVLLALLGSLGAGAAFWLDRSAAAARARLAAREDDWTSQLKAAAPLGADKATVQHWLEDTLPDPQQGGTPLFNEDTHSFLVNAEDVDAGGVHFPCSAWTITLEITLGPDDKVVRRQVGAVGKCVMGLER
jgi:hypothetical protein